MPETNPIDGYRDIYPWPYHWHKSIKGLHISRLTPVSFVYDNADYWTYENHKSFREFPNEGLPEDMVDIYWKDDDGERQQLPPPIGDHMVQILTGTVGDDIMQMLWFGREFNAGTGWKSWSGKGGEFVDHIHIEFRPEPPEDEV